MYGIDILIIADDPSSMQELKHKLQDEGYGVTCCLNKEKGLTAIEESEFDVVIIDLEHESIDEFTLLRRSKELYPATEVIIITASASEHTVHNKTQSAEILGIDRVSPWRKLKRYGLETSPIVAQ